MKNLCRIAVLVLMGAVSAVVGVATSSPAHAADVIAIANYNTGKCAEPVNGANGAWITQLPCDGGPAQYWARIGVGDRYYILINQAYPNMCLDVRNAVGGNNVQIWSCSSSKGMHWRFDRVELPYDKIVSQISSSWCLTLAAGQPDPVWLTTYHCQNYFGGAQIWEIR